MFGLVRFRFFKKQKRIPNIGASGLIGGCTQG
jgi:hypothetical protein